MRAAQMVNSEVSSQSEKPGVEISPRIKAPDLRSDAQPGLLEEIFRFGWLSHQAEQVAIQTVLIALHQSGKRFEVPASKPGHVGVETHSHLHRAGKLAYHTVPYTDQQVKKTHKARFHHSDPNGSYS